MQQTSRKALPPQMLKVLGSRITLVGAGVSDTLLGNRAQAGYGGDNEGLIRSAVCCCLPPSNLFKTRRNFLEVKFQENCRAQTRQGIRPKFLAEFELGRRLNFILEF